MVLATYRTTARLCEMKSIEVPSSRWSPDTRLSTVALDGDVEGRGDLVGDDDLGPGGDGPGQGDPLALPAGQLPG